MTSNKEKYRNLCEEEESIPIFSQAWWLDSVAKDKWDVVLIENGDRIDASLPYVLDKKYGFTLITQPKLTQTLGPWIRASKAKYARRLSREKDLLQELFALLPKHDYYAQNWHYSMTNWLPLYWQGYEQTTRYTYTIKNISSLDSIWKEMSSSYRNKIRNAESIVEVRHNLDIKTFFEINKKTFDRQAVSIPYSFSFLKEHHELICANQAGHIFYAVDKQENLHSALYLTWDDMSAYVHLVGEDPEFRNSGAGVLLIWHAIQYVVKELELSTFDFEGSMIESVERVRRDFGGRQTPYFAVKKTNSKLLKAYRAFKNIY